MRKECDFFVIVVPLVRFCDIIICFHTDYRPLTLLGRPLNGPSIVRFFFLTMATVVYDSSRDDV